MFTLPMQHTHTLSHCSHINKITHTHTSRFKQMDSQSYVHTLIKQHTRQGLSKWTHIHMFTHSYGNTHVKVSVNGHTAWIMTHSLMFTHSYGNTHVTGYVNRHTSMCSHMHTAIHASSASTSSYL